MPKEQEELFSLLINMPPIFRNDTIKKFLADKEVVLFQDEIYYLRPDDTQLEMFPSDESTD